MTTIGMRNRIYFDQFYFKPTAGSQPDNTLNVQAAWASAQAIGSEPSLGRPSSTDSNVAINLGIPALIWGGRHKRGITFI